MNIIKIKEQFGVSGGFDRLNLLSNRTVNKIISKDGLGLKNELLHELTILGPRLRRLHRNS